MDIGTILLYITFLLIASDVFILLFNKKIQNWLFYDHFIVYGATITLLGSFLEFILNLVVQDYSYAYVTEYSSIDMDIPLRIASSWSGAAGSFFLWTMLLFTAYLIFRFLFRNMIKEQIYQYASIIQAINILAFLIFIFIKDPFAKNFPVPSNGLGLNPLLSNFLNLIHPPIIFTGYSILILPFSIALAKLITGQTDNEAPAEIQKFLRLAMAVGWMVLGTGILIGGYWAYTTLGWGGFWAWDPVETGSLIPWLFALVYFHGSPVFHSDKGNFGKDVIATFPFLSVLFATIVTRTGLLSSVHAFGNSVSDYIIIIYLLGILVIEGFFIYKLQHQGKIKFFYSFEELKTIKRQDAALYISFFCFLLGTIAIMTGLIIPLIFALLPEPFNQSFIVDKKYFNVIIGLFGLGALEAAFFTDFVFIKTDNNKLLAIAIGVLAGITNVFLNLPVVNYSLRHANLGIIYNLLYILGTTSLLANFILPILIISLGILMITVYKFFKSKDMQKQVKMRKISQTFLHLGIVIALIGALISYNTTVISNTVLSPTESGRISVSNNAILTVQSVNFQFSQDNFQARLQAHVILKDGNQVIGEGNLEYTNYTLYGTVASVLIISNFITDYYFTIMTFDLDAYTSQITDIQFQVRIIPMINFLWIGALVVISAMFALVVVSLRLFVYSYKKAKGQLLKVQDGPLLKNNPLKV